MSYVLEAIEPHGRPARRSVALEPSDTVSLWALPAGGARGLRRTVFRGPDQGPPPDAVMIVALRADDSGLAVLEVGRTVICELLRADHRTRLVSGMRLPVVANLELGLDDGTRLDATLALRRRTAGGAEQTLGAGGTRKSRVVYNTNNVWWMITDGKGLVVTFGIQLWDKARDRLMKLGIDSRVLSFVGGLLLAAFAGFYVSYTQYQRAEAQQERADEAEGALARAEAAQQASLATELACLAQRQDLVTRLGQQDARRSLAAEMALGLSLSNTVAVELGDARMGDPRLLEADGLLLPGLLKAVTARLERPTGDPKPCRAQLAALGADLPAYLLLYHPDPALVCPADYTVVDAGVDRAGRFGLSERLARSYRAAGEASTGAPPGTLDELLGDPRLEDRWSAFTLAAVYRSVTRQLVRGARTDRPPVYPSQAQLWALALTDAANRLPSTPAGALDAPIGTCIDRLLEHRVATLAPSGPGEPVLPDLVGVASGDIVFAAPPTPGCPWPRDVLQTSARAALATVGHQAALQLEEE